MPFETQGREREGRDAAGAHAALHGGEERVLLRGAEDEGAGEAYVEGLRGAEV